MNPLFFSLALAFFVNACAYYTEKSPGDPSTIDASTVAWPQVSAEVFDRRCSICHGQGGAGINTTDRQSILNDLTKVQEQVFQKQSMPPGTPLTAYEQALLTDWIQNVKNGTTY